METPRDAAEGQGQSSLCRAGCGFYGSPANEGLCSKCFKDALDKKADPAQAAALGGAPPTPSSGPVPPPMMTSSASMVTAKASSPINVPSDASTAGSSPSSLRPSTSAASSVGDAGTATESVLPEASSSSASLPSAETASSESSSLPAAASEPADLASGAGGPKKKKSRCSADGCRVKLGLMGWDCRCGLKFCSEHRYSDQHNCTFDYQSQGKAQLAKANPKVVAAKINKI